MDLETAMKRPFRKEYRPGAIVSGLESIIISRPSVSLWQKIDGQRVKCRATVERFIDNKSLIEVVHNMSKEFPFDTERPLYLYSTHRNTAFKSYCQDIDQDKMILRVPSLVVMNELRTEVRKSYLYDDVKIKLTKQLSHGKQRTFQKNIIDFSQGGLSFRIPRREAQFFEVGDELYFEDLKSGPKKATLKYIGPFHESGYQISEFVRVGVQFV